SRHTFRAHVRRLRAGRWGCPPGQRIDVDERRFGWFECTSVGQAAGADDAERIIGANDLRSAPGAWKAARLLKGEAIGFNRRAVLPPYRLPPQIVNAGHVGGYEHVLNRKQIK